MPEDAKPTPHAHTKVATPPRPPEGPSLRDLPKSPGNPIGTTTIPKPATIYNAKPDNHREPDPPRQPNFASTNPTPVAEFRAMMTGEKIAHASCPICTSDIRPGKSSPSTGTVVVGCFSVYLATQLLSFTLSLPAQNAELAPPMLGTAAMLALAGVALGSRRQRGLRCTECRWFTPT